MKNKRDNDMGCSTFFALALAILFIGLKLTGYIDWAWVWVLSPLWVPFVFALPVILLITLAALTKGWFVDE